MSGRTIPPAWTAAPPDPSPRPCPLTRAGTRVDRATVPRRFLRQLRDRFPRARVGLAKGAQGGEGRRERGSAARGCGRLPPTGGAVRSRRGGVGRPDGSPLVRG